MLCLSGPEEGEGPECSFRDECACGWSYVSSNVNDVWLRTPRDRVINSTEPEGKNILYIEIFIMSMCGRVFPELEK